MEFLRTNFLHVAPILVAGAIAIAIGVERCIALFKRYPIANLDAFFARINDLVMADKISEAIAVCDQMPEKPSAQVVKLALLRAHQPEELIENGLGISVNKAAQTIQKRTQFLATIANVATLLGLLGTIAGLIASFQAVGTADASQKSALLANGISTAMNATMLGLAVAIPCMVLFSFLMNRTNRLVAEVDQSAMQAMDILKQKFYAAQEVTLKSVRSR
ncbi:MAG: MotA/TolQ/ExbB proton channel family protein [Cryobacterium sp.]|nr:MotA/TolQ/ExbB proton channel family protein [Oligoflexia bacterium]